MILFTIGWLVWLALFLAWELYAYFWYGENATLSAHIRRWIGLEPRKDTLRIIGVPLFLLFVLWFALHITLGILP